MLSDLVLFLVPELCNALTISKIFIEHFPEVAIGLHGGQLSSCESPLAEHHSYVGAELLEAASLCQQTHRGQVLATNNFISLVGPQTFLDYGTTTLQTFQLELNKNSIRVHPIHESSSETSRPVDNRTACVSLSEAIRIILDVKAALLTSNNTLSLNQIASSYDAILTLISDNTTTQPELVGRVIVELSEFLTPWWNHEICFNACEELLGSWCQGESDLYHRLRVFQCKYTRISKDIASAIEKCEQYLEEFGTAVCLHRTVTYVNLYMSTYARMQQDELLARKYAQIAYLLAKKNALQYEVGLAHLRIGLVELELGADLVRSISEYEQALSVAHSLENVQLELMALMDIGVAEGLRDLSKAQRYLGKALSLSYELQTPLHTSTILQAFADTYVSSGDYANAIEVLHRARVFAHKSPGSYVLGNVYHELALVYALVGDYLNSYINADKALAIYKRMGAQLYALDSACVLLFAQSMHEGDLVDVGLDLSVSPWHSKFVLLVDFIAGDATDQSEANSNVKDCFLDVISHVKGEHAKLVSAWKSAAFSKWPNEMMRLFPTPTLVVASDFSWFRAPGFERANIGHRPYLHRMFMLLVNNKLSRVVGVNTNDLIAYCWPGQILIHNSGANRVYVGISHLKRLGLAEWIEVNEQGYSLSSVVDIVIVRSTV